jgi:hypothetical protein
MVFSLTRASDIEADPYLGVVNVMVGWFGSALLRQISFSCYILL